MIIFHREFSLVRVERFMSLGNALPTVMYPPMSRLLLAIVLHLSLASPLAWAATENPVAIVPNWTKLAETVANHIEKVETDQTAIDQFIGTIGPALSLNDVAQALGAKGIPPRLAEELLIPEIRASAKRLMAALVARHLSGRLTGLMDDHATQEKSSPGIPATQTQWLVDNGPFPSLTVALQEVTAVEKQQADPANHPGPSPTLLVSAGKLAEEANQQAMEEWWRLQTWKDRVRIARGQSRLCGTWQWVVHNHQKHHQEQKLSLLFPPPGPNSQMIPGLTELVALGDTVYLRWEMNGHTQEDSLLFSKEGNRLEGTFVNSQGGWGSITGKRTASCSIEK